MRSLSIKNLLGYIITMVLFTLVISVFLIISNITSLNNYIYYICIIQAISDITSFYIYSRLALIPFKEFFGLYTKKLPIYILLGFIGFIIVILVNFLSVFLDHKTLSLTSVYNSDLLTLSLTAIIIAPIREEFLFRGIIQPFLVVKTNKLIGIAITCILFSGSHIVYGANYIMYLKLLVLAIVLSILKEKTNSILPGYFTHLFINILGILCATMQ